MNKKEKEEFEKLKAGYAKDDAKKARLAARRHKPLATWKGKRSGYKSAQKVRGTRRHKK